MRAQLASVTPPALTLARLSSSSAIPGTSRRDLSVTLGRRYRERKCSLKWGTAASSVSGWGARRAGVIVSLTIASRAVHGWPVAARLTGQGLGRPLVQSAPNGLTQRAPWADPAERTGLGGSVPLRSPRPPRATPDPRLLHVGEGRS